MERSDEWPLVLAPATAQLTYAACTSTKTGLYYNVAAGRWRKQGNIAKRYGGTRRPGGTQAADDGPHRAQLPRRACMAI